MKDADKIDFFIPLHHLHPLFQSCIEAIVSFYSPRTIYIVTSKMEIPRLESAVSTWNKESTLLSFIEEENFFTNSLSKEEDTLTKDSMESQWYNYKDEKSREFGWWYQQILKLGALSRIPEISDPFIVCDSDLIPLKKWPIYPCEAVPFFQFALLQEKEKSIFNKEEYKASLEYLLQLHERLPNESKGTFVPHHFVFHHCVIRDFIQRIEFLHPERKSWMETIVSLSHDYYRFSEYKSIATFMSYFYPELLFYHSFEKYGEKGIRIRDEKEAEHFVKKLIGWIGKNEISYKEFRKCIEIFYKKEIPTYIQVEQ